MRLEADPFHAGHVVAMKAMPNFEASVFNSFSHEGHVNTVKKFIDNTGMKPHNYGIADEFLASTRNLAPLCRSVFELRYLADIQRAMNLARIGDPEGEPAALWQPRCPPHETHECSLASSIHGVLQALQHLRRDAQRRLDRLH